MKTLIARNLLSTVLLIAIGVGVAPQNASAAKSPKRDRAFSKTLQLGQGFAVTSTGCALSVTNQSTSRLDVSCSRKAKVKTGSARIALTFRQFGILRAQGCALSVTTNRADYVRVRCTQSVPVQPVKPAPATITGVVNGECLVDGVNTGELVKGNGFCSATGLMYQNGSPANSVINGLLYQSGLPYSGVYRGGLYQNGNKISVDSSLDTQTFQDKGYVRSEAGVRDEVSYINPEQIITDADGAISVFGYSYSENLGDTIFLLTRFLKDGSVDTSFGDNGVVNLTTLLGDYSIVNMSLVGSKYVVDTLTKTARLNKDGSLDQTFATAGILDTKSIGVANYQRFTVQLSDGGMLIGAYGDYLPTLTIARFTSSGVKDTSFGSNGEISMSRTARSVHSVAHPDGKVTLSVWYTTSVAPNGFTTTATSLYRINADGSFDTSFGTQGEQSIPNGRQTRLTLLPDGKMLGLQPLTFDASLIRFLASGQIDTSYGTNGQASIPSKALGAPNGNWPTLARGGFTVLEDGRALVIGSTIDSTSVAYPKFSCWVARYTADGVLDTSFDTDGIQQYDFFDLGGSTGYAVTTAPDGRIVGAGSAFDRATWVEKIIIFRMWT